MFIDQRRQHHQDAHALNQKCCWNLRFKKRGRPLTASRPFPHQEKWKEVIRNISEEADNAELLENVQILGIGDDSCESRLQRPVADERRLQKVAGCVAPEIVSPGAKRIKLERTPQRFETLERGPVDFGDGLNRQRE